MTVVMKKQYERICIIIYKINFYTIINLIMTRTVCGAEGERESYLFTRFSSFQRSMFLGEDNVTVL